MDYLQIFQKSLQFHDHIYCIRPKPYFSFGLGLNHYSKTTNLHFFTEINNEKEKGWSNQYCIIVNNNKYPRVTFYLNPFQFVSLNFTNKNFDLKLNPSGPLILVNLYKKELSYSLKAYFGSQPSVAGSFKVNNRFAQSVRLSKNNISFAYKIIANKYLNFLAGFVLKNTHPIIEDLISSFAGFQFFISDHQISITPGFYYDDFELAIHHRRKNNRLTFVYKNSPEYDEENNSNLDSYYFQYKFVSNNGNKIGVLCDIPNNILYTRVSVKITQFVKLKMTNKLNFSDGEFHFEPTFGFNFNLF